jgi:hypothetical protein
MLARRRSASGDTAPFYNQNTERPMKLFPHITLTAALLGVLHAPAAIVIPEADGSDGALNLTANTVIDLFQAVTGQWDANNAANAGKGIYDSNKWAVVFKYSSVNIAGGATVTFKNHASRAPVVWLVNGNVTINGTVSLDGQAGQNSVNLPEPGPGGFRGGISMRSIGIGNTAVLELAAARQRTTAAILAWPVGVVMELKAVQGLLAMETHR